ncbi:hypothetical protein HD806DRAFT_352156 [Xylariaceae sp. AK1471]|nr:hypothetical protein HD806DRAFT_352156 [Xylariaceae sp. AK1471]
MAVGESGTLAPLPSVVHTGSFAIAVFAITSFVTALALFVYLTYKVISWQLGRGSDRSGGKTVVGYQFASGTLQFGPAHDVAKIAGPDPAIDAISLTPTDRAARPRRPNQFLVLFVNLLLADLQQATAFALSTSWVVQDGIAVGTGVCFAQGLFVSVGDLASSCFMSAIAIHTFYSIVHGYRPPHRVLYFYILLIWIFVYLISLLPVAGTMNGASAGGFFVRAGAWCWVNQAYGDIRLLTHYIFIFIAIILSWVLYTAIFISLRRQQRRGDLAEAKNSGYHHPAFLIYPIIYLLCILPLAVGRVATMAGKDPPLGYFCFAGALVASNGWLDVLLFTSTRRSIVFAHGDDLGNEDTGINTFTFTHSTPKTFGNTIWVRGGRDEQHRNAPTGGWWRILGDPETQARKQSRLGKSLSQTSLTPIELNAIQMEVVTTVVVEDDRSPRRIPDYSDSTSTRSINRNGPYQ